MQNIIPVASIDVPSGWDVEQATPSSHLNGMLLPEILISLSAPKLCAKYFSGKYHYLGGRFLSPTLKETFSLNGLPEYPGISQCVLIPPKLEIQGVPEPDEDDVEKCTL